MVVFCFFYHSCLPRIPAFGPRRRSTLASFAQYQSQGTFGPLSAHAITIGKACVYAPSSWSHFHKQTS